MFRLVIHQKGSQDSKADNTHLLRFITARDTEQKGEGKDATEEFSEVWHRVPRTSLTEATQELVLFL